MTDRTRGLALSMVVVVGCGGPGAHAPRVSSPPLPATLIDAYALPPSPNTAALPAEVLYVMIDRPEVTADADGKGPEGQVTRLRAGRVTGALPLDATRLTNAEVVGGDQLDRLDRPGRIAAAAAPIGTMGNRAASSDHDHGAFGNGAGASASLRGSSTGAWRMHLSATTVPATRPVLIVDGAWSATGLVEVLDPRAQPLTLAVRNGDGMAAAWTMSLHGARAAPAGALDVTLGSDDDPRALVNAVRAQPTQVAALTLDDDTVTVAQLVAAVDGLMAAGVREIDVATAAPLDDMGVFGMLAGGEGFGGLIGSDGSAGGVGSGGTLGHGAGSGTGSTYGVGGGGSRSRVIPKVVIAEPTVGPSADLDPAIIKRYIKRNIGKISSCYEQALLDDATLGGKVATTFVIGADGKVTSATVTGVRADVETCVAAVLRTIEFPKPSGGGVVTVNYPFVFRPTGS